MTPAFGGSRSGTGVTCNARGSTTQVGLRVAAAVRNAWSSSAGTWSGVRPYRTNWLHTSPKRRLSPISSCAPPSGPLTSSPMIATTGLLSSFAS